MGITPVVDLGIELWLVNSREHHALTGGRTKFCVLGLVLCYQDNTPFLGWEYCVLFLTHLHGLLTLVLSLDDEAPILGLKRPSLSQFPALGRMLGQ